MRIVSSLLLIVGLVLTAQSALAVDPYAGVDPYWVVLHEPALQSELSLSPDQQAAYTALLDRLDQQFFTLRNKSQADATAGITQIVQQTKQELESLLKPAQRQRIEQILLRRRGTRILLDENIATKLRLSPSLQKQIEKIIEETEEAVAKLREDLQAGEPREPLGKKYQDLHTQQQRDIFDLLTLEQKTDWRDLLGESFDTSSLGRPAYKAPELINTGEWINGQVSSKDLQGKVVVVNFYAAGCINCIHNYPSYRTWQAAYQDNEDIQMIGIHTPETSAERVTETVRKKAAAEKLLYPIVIDGKSENWNAWGNSMWPSVYLVDKRGYLRYFWPGELKWQGQDGEAYMQARIEELLLEDTD